MISEPMVAFRKRQSGLVKNGDWALGLSRIGGGGYAELTIWGARSILVEGRGQMSGEVLVLL